MPNNLDQVIRFNFRWDTHANHQPLINTCAGKLIIVLLASMLAACSAASRPDSHSRDGRLSELEFRVMDLEETVAFGINNAKAWRQDAILTQVDLGFAPSNTDVDLYTFLGYNAADEPTLWLLQEVREGSNGQLVLTYQSGGEFEDARRLAEPIDPSALQLSPSEAMLTAFQSVEDSSSFLSETEWPASLELTRRDQYEFNGPVTWIVSLSPPGRGGSVHVYIDDATSEILEVRDFSE